MKTPVVAKLAVRAELDEIRQVYSFGLGRKVSHLCKTKRDASFTKAKFAITLDGLIKSDAILREKTIRFFWKMPPIGSWVGTSAPNRKIWMML